MFASENVRYKNMIICKKHIISSCSVMLVDFEHLNLGSILRISSLEFFVTIKEQIYPELVKFFFSNFPSMIISSDLVLKMLTLTSLLKDTLEFFICHVRVWIFLTWILMILSISTVSLLSPPLVCFMFMITWLCKERGSKVLHSFFPKFSPRLYSIISF